MFTAFVGMLAITWPFWAMIDVWLFARRTWWNWRMRMQLKGLIKDLEQEVARAIDEKDKP